MKKYKASISVMAICILFSLNLTSCRSSNELNKLAIVMGAGIDKAKDKDKVQVTIQIANVMKMKSSSGKSGLEGGENSYLNFSDEGSTIIDAINKINHKLNRTLFFPDNQVIIFSKDIAEEGLQKYIDFFLRNRETRLLQWLLVSDEKASEILSTKPEFESTTGRSIGELIKSEKSISQVPAVNLMEFSQKLMSKTTAPALPLIEITEEKNRTVLHLSKSVVFNKDKLAGSLNDMETKGYLWGAGKMKENIVTVNLKDNKNKVSLQVRKSKSKIIPKVNDGEVKMIIKIETEGDLGEQTSTENEATPIAFKELEKAEEDSIKKEVMSALTKAKELKSDIFGFGDIIYMHYPKEWSNLENSWDETFQNIKVDVNVKAKVKRTGRITKPIMSKEE